MEGRDHDLLVRIDERVMQIHTRLGKYDEDLECINERTTTLESNQSKAIGIITAFSLIITFIGKYIIDFFISFIKKA